MFVVDVTVDLYATRYADSERTTVTLGLSDEDALFAFHNSWYKIGNTIAKLTPWRVIVRDVQFSPEDRERVIDLSFEKMKREREMREQRESLVVQDEEHCGTYKCEHVDCWN